MKRAEVAKLPFRERTADEVWYFDVFDAPVEPEVEGLWIRDRPEGTSLEPVGGDRFPTHQEALDAALVAVGLAKPAEHREAP